MRMSPELSRGISTSRAPRTTMSPELSEMRRAPAWSSTLMSPELSSISTSPGKPLRKDVPGTVEHARHAHALERHVATRIRDLDRQRRGQCNVQVERGVEDADALHVLGNLDVYLQHVAFPPQLDLCLFEVLLVRRAGAARGGQHRTRRRLDGQVTGAREDLDTLDAARVGTRAPVGSEFAVRAPGGCRSRRCEQERDDEHGSATDGHGR